MLVAPVISEMVGEPFKGIGAVLFGLTGNATAGQADDCALMDSQVLDGVVETLLQRLCDRLRPLKTDVERRFFTAQVFRRVRCVDKQ